MMAPEKSGYLSPIYLIFIKLMCVHRSNHLLFNLSPRKLPLRPAVICLLFQVSAILMDILCPICEIHVWVQQESAQNNSHIIERVLLTGA